MTGRRSLAPTARSGPADPGKRVAAPSGRRALTVAVLMVLACAALVPGLVRSAPLVVWNASPSTPVGLYLVVPAEAVAPGATVVAWPPRTARALAAARGYLPRHVPLVKRVAAVEGDRVCAAGASVTVNGRRAASRRRTDPSGRPLPWWTGCRRLRRGELLLLSPGKPDAFDGRYFGVIREELVVGRARLLWPA